MDAGIKVAQIIPIVVPKVDKTDRLKSVWRPISFSTTRTEENLDH